VADISVYILSPKSITRVSLCKIIFPCLILVVHTLVTALMATLEFSVKLTGMSVGRPHV
jgi:hypothetical protein